MAETEVAERQFSTFFINDRMYGIDVQQVQEVTSALNMTAVPLAPPFVKGVINLRGQISTAVALKDFFGISKEIPDTSMHVVCSIGGNLISFIVDRVGDVMAMKADNYEVAPDTVPSEVKDFLQGVYKLPKNLMSVLDIEKIWNHINHG